VTVGTVVVTVAMYEVTVMLVVMFDRTNPIVTNTVVPPMIDCVTTVVVTGPCIGFTAGAFVGIRTPSAARVTQTITRALIASGLFKSVPSRC
jgi:hypothetical protein